MITRTGYIVRGAVDQTAIKRELTVRPVENAVGIQAPAFKVYRSDAKGNLCVPRYYGHDKFGPGADRRPEPKQCDIKFAGTLRDYQQRALDLFDSGVLSLPCGYGKTTVALAIAAKVKVRTMIIVHKEFLATQWRERILQFCPGASIGLVQGSVCDTDKDFVIAMIQTMCMREHPIGTFDSVGLLIVDEAHHIGAPAFSQFMFKLCPKYTLGLTATPDRKDGLTRLLYWFMGPAFFTVERENCSAVSVVKVPFDAPEFRQGVPLNRMGKVSLADIVNTLVEIPSRNKVILDIVEKCKGRKLLILTDRRNHCFELAAALPESGLYIGGMKEADLEKSSEKDIIIGTFSLAHEGLDIPTLDTVILATPHSDVKQAVGRILRGKSRNPPVIYDLVDQWSILLSMWRKRLDMYCQSGFDVPESEPLREKQGFKFIL